MSQQTTVPTWATPEVEQVTGGVFRLPLPIPDPTLRAVNVYAVVEPAGLTLIDSGWAGADGETALVARLSDIGHTLDEVTRFIVTHAHPDHLSQALRLRDRFGARVQLGSGERITLESMVGNEPMNYQAIALAAAGAQEISRTYHAEMARRWADGGGITWGLPDDWLEDRQVLDAADRTLEVIATPGHTRGHVVVRDAALGLLFAGDHILPHITPSIGFERRPEPTPLRSYLDSLQLVRDLPDLRLLPAHGPITPSAHVRIDELLDHHAQRLEECLRRVTAGDQTSYAVALSVPWTRRESRLVDLPLQHQALAILETTAHLDVLVLDGQLAVETVNGVRRYAPRP